MNIREEIKKYNFYIARIKKLELQIHEIENENYNLKSPTLDGLPRASGFGKSSLEERVIDNEDRITLIRQEIRKIYDIIHLLDSLINTLKESNRKIMKARFIDNQDIQKIADSECKEYKTIQATIDSSINIMQENFDKEK